MSDYSELVQVLKYLLNEKFYPQPQYIKALLGNGRGEVLVPGREDFNYVRFNRSANETFEVFNKEVNQPVDGTPILVGEYPWSPGLMQVVGIDWAAYSQTGWGNRYAQIQAHAPTHEWPDFSPGSDYMRVHLRSIFPLQGYGGGTGSMSFTAHPYQYDYTGTNSYWSGTPTVDLGPTKPPTGTMRYMGVYLNPATNALGVVTGSSVSYDQDTEPPYPAWPLNVYPVAFARVYGGQAYFIERDIKDARRLWNTTLMFTGTSGGGGASAASQAEVDAGTVADEYVSPLTLANYPPILLKVKNTSGGTLTAGSMVYTLWVTGSGMEAKSPASSSIIYATTAAVVIVGGANNADIKVATRGRHSIFYSSTAPSIGDYLILGAANTVTRQTYMSPEVVAIAMAAGSGGSVDALLLTQTTPVAFSSADPLIQIPVLMSDSTFVGTIATLPGGAVLTYTVTSGDENWLIPFSTTTLAKLVLHNTTRGTSALISNSVAATNTITLTANVPAGWATTDVITIRSQTNTDTSGGAYFLDFELTDTINPLTRWMDCDFSWTDTGAPGQRGSIHPYETYSASKVQFLDNAVTARIESRTVSGVPLIQKRFTIRADASGSATAIYNLYILKLGVASP